MENKILIDSVNNLKVALNEISVYDFDVYTSMELYYKIAENFNKVIRELSRFEGVISEEIVKQNEKLIYLLNEGLNQEVVNKIDNMVETGVFDTIINHNIFNSLKNEISKLDAKIVHKVDTEQLNNIQSQVDDLVLGAVGDGNNAEVVQARGHHNLLKDRVGEIENQSKSIGDYAIGSFIDLVGEINNIPMEIGQAVSTGIDYSSKNRCTSISAIYLKKESIISLKDFENYSFALCYYDIDGTYISGTSWINSSKIIDMEGFYKIVVKKNTDYIITNLDLSVISNLIVISQNNTVNKKLDISFKELDIIKGNIESITPIYNITPNGNIKNIVGGDYWIYSFYDNNKDGKYRLVLETNDLEGKYGQYICIRQRGVNGQNANRTNAKFLGDGIYYLNHQNINTDDYYTDISIFVDMRTFIGDNLNITQLKLSKINNDFPSDLNNRLFDLNISLAKLNSGFEGLNSIYSGTNLIIDKGNFLQLYIKDYESTINQSYRALVQTDDLEGKYSSFICLRQGSSSNRNANRVNATYLSNGYYYIELDTLIDETLTNMEFFIDLREETKGLKIIAYQVSKVIKAININSLSNSEKILYVSTNGSDINNGLTRNDALATFKKAYELGATTILCERGNYYNQPPLQYMNQYGKSLKILPYDNNEVFNYVNPSRKLINIINGNEITDLIEIEGLLTKEIVADSRMTQVFIDKTLPPVVDSRSIGYNSTIWQLHDDDTLDTKLKPVLTLEECKAEKGTFHYDGVKVYINPFATIYTKFILPNSNNNMIQLNGFKELVIEDMLVSFSYNNNFTLMNNMNMTLKNCQAKYACLGQGFALDNSNANSYNCYAFKNRNDGFNLHGYGVTNFFNCSGKYNYDDGISHHDGCEGIIDGGEWSYNGKGGISSPTYGAYVDIYNVECHNNKYGIYGASSVNNRKCKGRIFNSVMYNNTSADIKLTLTDIKVYNTKYTTKDISSDASLTEL